MQNQAGFTKAQCVRYWAEAASTATKLGNISVNDESGLSPYYQFYGKEASYSRHLRTFGEIGVAASHAQKASRSHIDERG